ncbi:hypothetical protein BDW62DRAFT_206257 [Aspergillus aurantiobrunneus]
MDDTGDTDDLDEADQLPVKAVGEKGSFLLLLQKHICRLSGISTFQVNNDFRFYTRQAPWDERTAVIRSESNPSMHKDALATALQREARDISAEHRLTCLLVHARCWQLLCKHQVLSLSGGDLRIITQALYHKSTRYWNKPPGLVEYKHPNDGPAIWEEDDVFCDDRVQSIIRQSRRRARTMSQRLQYRHQQIYLNCLPREVLLLIADLIHPPDGVAVQKATGCYLCDAYWRSRIPNVFHEVQDLSSEEPRDWEYLCLQLNKLKSCWAMGFHARLFLYEQLDETSDLIVNHANNT